MQTLRENNVCLRISISSLHKIQSILKISSVLSILIEKIHTVSFKYLCKGKYLSQTGFYLVYKPVRQTMTCNKSPSVLRSRFWADLHLFCSSGVQQADSSSLGSGSEVIDRYFYLSQLNEVEHMQIICFSINYLHM